MDVGWFVSICFVMFFFVCGEKEQEQKSFENEKIDE